MVRPLFILGPARTGTTALADYLNQHEEILICRERYKWAAHKVDSAALTFEAILDYEPGDREDGDTNIPREHHEELLAGKDPAKLKWVGDKQPGRLRHYKALARNNPGAHFLITYRSIEEVAESSEARSKKIHDSWIGGKDGFRLGAEGWNRYMNYAREYLEGADEPNALIINYDDFFDRGRKYAPLLSWFLELDFDDSILESWDRTSREFEAKRRKKESITEKKSNYIEANKDRAVEEWMLDRIESQWDEPTLYKQNTGQDNARRKLAAALMKERRRAKPSPSRLLERDVKRLENELRRERRNTSALHQENKALDDRINAIQTSRGWRLLSKLRRLRTARSG